MKALRKPRSAPSGPCSPSAEPPSIIDCMDRDDIFGTRFRGPSWTAWRSFLKTIFALPMDEAEMAIFRTCTALEAPPRQPADEAALVVGRRGGKSQVKALIACYLAAFRDYRPYLAPGEVATVSVLASQRKQARNIMRFVTGLLEASPHMAALITDKTNESITLSNRVVIEVTTASISAVRGASYACVLADEIAFWMGDELSANPDREVLRSIRPALGTIPGSLLILGSSPYAQKGELWETYKANFGVKDAPVITWQAPTLTMNPSPRLEKMRAREMEKDPESAKAEWDAQFRTDLSDFVNHDQAQAVTAAGRYELPRIAGMEYRAFVDPSGGLRDSMTLAVGHLEGNTAVLDCVREIRPPFNPDKATAEIARTVSSYGISRVMTDRYGGEWVRSRFDAHGITVEYSPRVRSEIYLDFLPLVLSKRVELLDHERALDQLVSLERRTARSGRDTVDHGRNGHDDVINSVAGVLVSLAQDRRPALMKVDDLRAGDAHVDAPTWADAVFSTVIITPDGMAAACYFAFTQTQGGGPSADSLILLDFDLAPYAAETVQRIVATQGELMEVTKPRHTWISVPGPLQRHFHMIGQSTIEIDGSILADPMRLALSCAGPVGAGQVRMAKRAAERAAQSPIGGLLEFRAGEDMSKSPLRLAFMVGVIHGFVPEAADWGPIAA